MNNVKQRKRANTLAYVIVGLVLTLFFFGFSYYLWSFDYKTQPTEPTARTRPNPQTPSNTEQARASLLEPFTPPAGVWPLLSGSLVPTSDGSLSNCRVSIRNTATETGTLPIIISTDPDKIFQITAVRLLNGKDAETLKSFRVDAYKTGYRIKTDSILYLAPGSAYSVDMPLKERFDFKTPGQYQINVSYDPMPLLASSTLLPDMPFWNRPIKSIEAGFIDIQAPVSTAVPVINVHKPEKAINPSESAQPASEPMPVLIEE